MNAEQANFYGMMTQLTNDTIRIQARRSGMMAPTSIMQSGILPQTNFQAFGLNNGMLNPMSPQHNMVMMQQLAQSTMIYAQSGKKPHKNKELIAAHRNMPMFQNMPEDSIKVVLAKQDKNLRSKAQQVYSSIQSLVNGINTDSNEDRILSVLQDLSPHELIAMETMMADSILNESRMAAMKKGEANTPQERALVDEKAKKQATVLRQILYKIGDDAIVGSDKSDKAKSLLKEMDKNAHFTAETLAFALRGAVDEDYNGTLDVDFDEARADAILDSAGQKSEQYKTIFLNTYKETFGQSPIDSANEEIATRVGKFLDSPSVERSSSSAATSTSSSTATDSATEETGDVAVDPQTTAQNKALIAKKDKIKDIIVSMNNRTQYGAKRDNLLRELEGMSIDDLSALEVMLAEDLHNGKKSPLRKVLDDIGDSTDINKRLDPRTWFGLGNNDQERANEQLDRLNQKAGDSVLNAVLAIRGSIDKDFDGTEDWNYNEDGAKTAFDSLKGKDEKFKRQVAETYKKFYDVDILSSISIDGEISGMYIDWNSRAGTSAP